MHEIRQKDPGLGGKKLWRMYCSQFPQRERTGRDKFTQIIAQNNLKVRQKMPRKPRTTDSTHFLPVFPNLVKNRIPKKPTEIWVADITYISLYPSKDTVEFCYLSLITDAYSHEIVGWAVGPTLETKYPLEALQMALKRTKDKGGDISKLVHHSDRGVQYASKEYVRTLQQSGIGISMTETGDPKDNAVAERINSTIKNELLKDRKFSSLGELKTTLSDAIDFYNNERPHMSVDMKTPAEAATCEGLLNKQWRSYREIRINEAQRIIQTTSVKMETNDITVNFYQL